MPFKKNIWFIYYAFLALGLVYLVASAYSRWDALKTDAVVELAYLNRILSSSLNLNFDQQEIMLDLLGRQLLAGDFPADPSGSRHLLDDILRQNKMLLGFGLADLDGNITVGSSNLDLSKMPNLMHLENSRKSFVKAMEVDRMVLGRTYFLPALGDMVIPIRKGIRDSENNLIGMMTAGIKPRELLPQLKPIDRYTSEIIPYRMQIFHAEDHYYAFVSGISDTRQLREIIDTPIPEQYLRILDQSLRDQLGYGLAEMKYLSDPSVFTDTDSEGRVQLHSLVYLPRYQMWSSSTLPMDSLLIQLWQSIIFYLVTFLIVIGLAYFMFRQIAIAEQKSHDELLRQAS